MNDKPIPKYQIREKTPDDEGDIIADKKLLKKIKKERIKLIKEKSEWENHFNQIENYRENIEDLEKKRKSEEIELKNLSEKRDIIQNNLKKGKNDIVKQKNELDAREQRLKDKIRNENDALNKKTLPDIHHYVIGEIYFQKR